MNLKFHQTFKAEKKYITQLMLLARNEPEMDVNEISMHTGIPMGKSSGKVVPHLEYARFMGLIDFKLNKGKYFIFLTNIGELVLEEDMALSEAITLLLLHSYMIRDEYGADLWNFTFIKFPLKYGNDTKYEYFENEVDEYFSSDVLIGPLKNTYDTFFKELNIIEMDKTKNFFRINRLNIDSQFIYLYAYVLYEYWDNKYANQDEISSNEFDLLGFNRVFSWSKLDELLVLEKLSDKGLIRMNKQLVPYTILKTSNKNNLLEKLYSELF